MVTKLPKSFCKNVNCWYCEDLNKCEVWKKYKF